MTESGEIIEVPKKEEEISTKTIVNEEGKVEHVPVDEEGNVMETKQVV